MLKTIASAALLYCGSGRPSCWALVVHALCSCAVYLLVVSVANVLLAWIRGARGGFVPERAVRGDGVVHHLVGEHLRHHLLQQRIHTLTCNTRDIGVVSARARGDERGFASAWGHAHAEVFRYHVNICTCYHSHYIKRLLYCNMLLHITGPPVPITARVHSTPQTR